MLKPVSSLVLGITSEEEEVAIIAEPHPRKAQNIQQNRGLESMKRALKMMQRPIHN